ncbi:nucleotidyltransferase domain-containing protein [Murimonas intestini]|uniref:Nucleotidyltransferase-like protein n=1 Tax=Murimonas intestini TaxID=1337051 RepID=A0AB73SY41_9FIRM|nr:nucleotidyltransferase domain-containing protein [Murimonas intestini]MCR1842221.1 nucleotidyltransferase domain-containing protein [Murimonas intestini]MCR1868303.1 nucleotidyltransferase domain-containing protein [Murimonas intestini]MCR1885747.1 nucleotidyltransferase domain-containing protein [Murimonas intestini]
MLVTIQPLLNQYIEALTKIYGTYLKSFILYGTYARSDYTRDSEIDIKAIAKREEYSNKLIQIYPFSVNVEKIGSEVI